MQSGNILVTGANSGLGFEVASQLVSAGHLVVLGCRTIEKAELAKHKILAKHPQAQITAAEINLASLKSVRQFVQSIEIPLSGMICNAGISYDTGLQYTDAQIELTFGVNHIAHFLLTKLILEKYPSVSRILVVSSDAHNPKKSKGFFPEPAFKDIRELAYPDKRNEKVSSKTGMLYYVHSKLCNVLFVYELSRKLSKAGKSQTIVTAFNPGFIPTTNLSRNESAITRWMLKNIFPYFTFFIKEIRTAEKSASDLIQVFFSNQKSGVYFDGLKEAESSELSYDLNLASALWEFSESLTSDKLPVS
jgi:NAD(P)-dependent dehydrogenase (short-subunit alcohol dehydrogenase family)